MFRFFSIIFFISSLLTVYGQKISVEEWEELTQADSRLLPKYGNIKKTQKQKQADENFIQEIMLVELFNNSRPVASRYYVQLGFDYLSKNDLSTAMFRFNQAYLLDSLNTGIYMGYGAVYLATGDILKAKNQFLEGLSREPENSHLLTSYASSLINEYYELSKLNLPSSQKENAVIYIDTALIYLLKSYQIDNKNANTLGKLSIGYFLKNNCINARKFYNEYQDTNNSKILTSSYIKDLQKRCKN